MGIYALIDNIEEDWIRMGMSESLALRQSWIL
jgi:hypothetical protein